MLRKQRNVGWPLAQRRQCQAGDVESMIEIGAEASGRHALGERPVGGGDDPHRDLARDRLAQAPDHAFLQDAQQVGLQVGRHVADLVEE